MTEPTNQTIHLAIETTGKLGSLAVMRGSDPVHFVNLSPTLRTAATLAPEVERALAWCRERDEEPEFVCVADGPGSFTGLRIGVTTAKSLSYGLGLPLVAVDSLAAIAAAARENLVERNAIAVALDAYRSQVYTARFRLDELIPPLDAIPEDWSAHPQGVAVQPHLQWESELRGLPRDTAIAGDAKPLGDRADQAVARRCDAIGVGMLGIRAAIAGDWTDPMLLVPRYLKPSAAEEKAAEKRATTPANDDRH
ncbi:MAG: tRNA (adenosine(37)-N6)-threonylcarbamoyltransferase complex dimerization subunit type 1 TsaB [Planctomycetota bacterium]